MTQQKKHTKLENALYVVATPIGNMADITFRAVDVLKNCNIILCESPKNSYNLLKHYDIDCSKILTYNDHSNSHQRQKILNFLQENNSISLISDAGTPLISDPGYKLVNYLRQQQQKIIPIPGPSSLISAISASGIACDNFTFLGFLPNLKSKRKDLIKDNKNNSFVFFESARNLLKSLSEIIEFIDDRNCCVAKEITKIHEELVINKISDIISFLEKNNNKLKGEFVVIIEKSNKLQNKISNSDLIDEIKKLHNKKMSLKDISQNLAEIYNLNKKEIYKKALEII